MAFTPWTAGTRITASKLAAMTPIFTNWTPAWTTSGVAVPSYGDAVLDCRYARSGDLVIAQFNITFGASTNFGSPTSDNWRFSLPVAAATSSPLFAGTFEAGVGVATKAVLKARLSGTTAIALEVMSGRVDGTAAVGGEVDGAAPEAWVAGDTLRGQLIYEAA